MCRLEPKMETKGLNTIQLRHALLENDVTREFFDGVYPVDHLKFVTQPPKLILVNTDPSYKPGKHWLLFFRDGNGAMEIFDSLGQDLRNFNFQIRHFAQKFDDTVRFIKYRVQPVNSALCGHYCLYYAYMRCSGNNMNDIVKDIPSAEWIRECVPILFDIPGIISECQTCKCIS